MAGDWVRQECYGVVNYVLEGDGFYVSFNPNLSVLGPRSWDSDHGGPETALCRPRSCLVLNGDFREVYEPLVAQGYEACKRFHDESAAVAESTWSRPG